MHASAALHTSFRPADVHSPQLVKVMERDAKGHLSPTGQITFPDHASLETRIGDLAITAAHNRAA
jgi:hypothetical protein